MGCAPKFKRFFNMFAPEIVVDECIFDRVRLLRSNMSPAIFEPSCCNHLSQIFDQIPQLLCLINSDEPFIPIQRPLSSIKRLDLRGCWLESFNTLVQYLPNLSTILLGNMVPDIKDLAQRFSFLFIEISLLKLICFKIKLHSDNENPTRHKAIALQVLTCM